MIRINNKAITNNQHFSVRIEIEEEKQEIDFNPGNYCMEGLIYNGEAKVLTKSNIEGVLFSNNIRTNAGTYQDIIVSLDDGYIWSDNTENDRTIECSITAQKCNAPTNINVNEDGKITWTASSNCPTSSYQLKIDNGEYENAASGVNKKDNLMTTPGRKTIYVKAVAKDLNYTDSDDGTKIIDVYSVTYNYSMNGGTSATTTSASVQYGSAISLSPTATKSGWTFVGWNTDLGATSGLSSLTMGSGNVTLYAIYKKTISIIFNVNGNKGSNETKTCTMYNNNTTCSITSPGISPHANTPTIIGWSSDKDNHVNNWTPQTSVNVNSDKMYFAQTKKSSVTYKLSYNANGGECSPPDNRCSIAETYNGNSQASTCSITLEGSIKKKRNEFVGWKSSANNTDYSAGSNYSINSDVTMTASWIELPLCRRATELHTSGNTTYGSLGTDGILAVGDAFDCDVNNDGYYDATTERFYYVSQYWNTGTDLDSFDDDYAVLIYYHDMNEYRYKWSNSNTDNNPTVAATYLPLSSTWPGVSLKLTTRTLINCSNIDCTSATAQSSFNYSSYAARFLTLQEIEQSGCASLSGKSKITDKGSLTACKFFYERSGYTGVESPDTVNTTNSKFHLETSRSSSHYSVDQKSDRRVNPADSATTAYGVRPAIEVPITSMQY